MSSYFYYLSHSSYSPHPRDLQPVDKRVLQKLPEAQFKEISDYNPPPAPPMPASYYKVGTSEI